MFFSPDLLSKRDSGFGLLWLAATLGPKSAFRKLPKRSVLSADITQLCELIATPVEPLALRLSSNLLVGAARVYKAKQDIFMTDVMTCFNSLKRVIDEFRSATTSEAQLQMAQPSVKSSAVTLRIDPDAAFAIDLDNAIGNWSEYLTFEDAPVASADASSDDEYNPKPQKGKRKAKMSVIPPLGMETARVNMHTLDENHGFLTTDSFDASFGEQGAAINSTSETGGFRFDDAFFDPFDGLDMNEGIGDDLVMELGEEWGAIPTKQNAEEDIHPNEVQTGFGYSAADIDYDMHVNDDAEMVPQEILQPALSECLYQNTHDQQAQLPPISPPLQSVESSHTSPDKPQIKCGDDASRDEAALPKKMKRARLVLDCRIELTDEELKAARMHYLEGQGIIRRELHIKKVEKERASLIHDLLWSAPDNVHAKELANFWINHYKMQVEARSCHTDVPDEYRVTNCAKKQIDVLATPTLGGNPPKGAQEVPAPGDSPTAISAPLEVDMIDFAFDYDPEINFDMDGSRLRSSEEPGQGRHASRPPSALYDNLGTVVDNSLSSRRSGLFPWDHAGKSTSEIGQEGSFRLQDSDKMSVDHAETRLRGNSLIRRDSSLPPGSLRPSIGSPVVAFQGSQIDDDFAFDVPEDDSVMMTHDPQKGQANLPALEKNSSNFLEYARMQYQSLSGSSLYLTFDDVVPKASSTAHVAAAALYHCLVLGTKNLIQLHQEKSYGQITIRIK